MSSFCTSTETYMTSQSFISQPTFYPNSMFFKDRTEAGRVLGGILRAYAHNPEVLVLALPRGGVPVAFEVACTLGAPLDIFLVRKLGVPVQTELAMGAIASGGVRVLNHDVIGSFGI